MRKHPVSIALSNSILQRIDQEAKKQRRSRSEYVELFFEDALFALPEIHRQTDRQNNR